MKKETRELLFLIWAWCDHEDKSTEFMFAYMSSETSLDYDEVVDFVVSTSEEERDEWYKANSNWLDKI